MENTTTNKEITAEETKRRLIKEHLEGWHLHPPMNASIEHLYKKGIVNGTFLIAIKDLMDVFASLQTEAKDREISERGLEVIALTYKVEQLESSLSLAKKENEELQHQTKRIKKRKGWK